MRQTPLQSHSHRKEGHKSLCSQKHREGHRGGFTALSTLEPVELVGQFRRHLKSHQGIGVDTKRDSYWLPEGPKSTKQLCLSSISIPSVSLVVLWRNRTNRLCGYAL